jgi:hypothetical protein
MVWEIPWETETVLDLVTQEPGRKLLELRQDLEEIRKRIASPVVQRLAAADYNLDSIYASLEGNAAGKLFQAASHYQQLVSKLIDQAQSNLAVADTHLDNMLMRIDEAAERAGSGQGGFGTGGVRGTAWRTGPPVSSAGGMIAGEKVRLQFDCLDPVTGTVQKGTYVRWGPYPTESAARAAIDVIASEFSSDWQINSWVEGPYYDPPGDLTPRFDAVVRACPPPGVTTTTGVGPHGDTTDGGGPPIQPPPSVQPPSGECVFQDLGPYPTEDAAKRKLADLRNSCPPDMVFEGHVSPRQIQREDGGFETLYYVSYRCCPKSTDMRTTTTMQTTGVSPTVTCPPPQVSCPTPQVTCPTPTIQVVLQCPSGGPPIGTGPTPTPTPVGPPVWSPSLVGQPTGLGESSTGRPSVSVPQFPVNIPSNIPTQFQRPSDDRTAVSIPQFPVEIPSGLPTGFQPPGNGMPSVSIPQFPVEIPSNLPTGFHPSSGTGTGEPTAETTAGVTTGWPPTQTGTGGGQCILPVLQPGSIVRHYEQGNDFDMMKLKADSIIAGAKTAKPEGQFSYMICQCGQTFILIVFEVVTTDADKCPVLVAESGEKPKAEFEVTSLPLREEDQPCWEIYPVGGDMFRLAWEYFRNRQQAVSILNQLKLEAP